MTKSVPRKKQEVALLTKLLQEHDIVGLANIENLPAPQFQTMRAKLRGDVTLLVAKKSLIRLAFANVKAEKAAGVEQLAERFVGMPALLFTKQNPFKLASTLRKNTSKAPAKPGQVAPHDIIIPAGPTPFAPGPIISDLGAAGLKTGVEGGKVAIKEDKMVAKEGDVIAPKIANVLAKLGIEPMEIGMNLVAVYDNGIMYGKDVLSVDESFYADQLRQAIVGANALALHVAYPTADTIKQLLGRAFSEAKALALGKDILSDEAIKKWIGEATRAAEALGVNVSASSAEEKKDEPKEAAPVQEKQSETRAQQSDAKASPHASEQNVTEADIDNQIEQMGKEAAGTDRASVEKLAQDLQKKGTLRDKA